jgi:beta-galactosidase
VAGAVRSGSARSCGRSKGRIVARAIVETTGAPVRLRLTAYRRFLIGDGRDATPITVEALDARGRAVPTANLPVRVEVQGARIIGLGNGDANSHEPEKGDARSLYNGLAQVIVQSTARATDPVILHARSSGLKPANVQLSVQRA